MLFAMLFTVGTNYFLFVNKADLGRNQANAARQDALLLDRQEKLAIGVSLSGANTLVVSASNIGGVSASIASIYLTDVTGKTINPPGVMGQAQTNLTAPPAQWPVTLNVGAKTSAISGCVSSKTGCNIAISPSSYSYVSGNIVVNVVTGRGNVFSAGYPSSLNGGTGSNTLVVTMNVYPTPPQTLVLDCFGCITDNVTVYNYGTSAVSGVALSPSPPSAQVTPTATVSGGTCGAPTPGPNIIAYPGFGKAPSIGFLCTYDAQTGAVGGFASFSGFAQGTLPSGALVSSALAVSNIIQIGGSSNVLTQGAFSVNFFFFGTSSCVFAGDWVAPCVKYPLGFPPSSVGGLPDGAITSVSTNHYVAYYVQITNNLNAPLEILKYTFLQLDASHPPPKVGNETDFSLAGDAATYNAQKHYYPNYNTNPPSFAPYAGDENTCAEVGPSFTPSPNCIDINYGKTVTLTFAACGYGSSNWDCGGSQYAHHFDSSVGCSSSVPDFSPNGSADVLTVVLSFMYLGQIYTQAIQFQGLAVVP
jgi:hypothetical protein